VEWKGKKIIGTLLSVALFISADIALAETSLRLIIEQHETKARIPVFSICPSIPNEFVIEKVGDEVGFADKKQPEKQTIKNGLLPKFDLKEIFAEGVFQVSNLNNGKQKCYFTVNAIPSGRINESLQKLEGSGKKALTSGKGWLLLEETLPVANEGQGTSSRLPAAATLATSPDSGISSILYEGTSSTTYPKYVCFRPFDFTGYTRYGSGIVTWNRDNPATNGYSIKDEAINSEWVRNLRCPKGANQSDHRVDGVYNVLWDALYGARALKVPDNCTATLNIDSSNRRYWSCCCNAAASYLRGKYCEWVDPRSLNGWPNAATRRCG
jgi:hypothetical protein